jgi:hypothetical protein
MWLTVAPFIFLFFEYVGNIDDAVSDDGTSLGGQHGVEMETNGCT